MDLKQVTKIEAWTMAMLKALCCAVKKYRLHITVKGEVKSEKWLLVNKELLSNTATFSDTFRQRNGQVRVKLMLQNVKLIQFIQNEMGTFAQSRWSDLVNETKREYNKIK